MAELGRDDRRKGLKRRRSYIFRKEPRGHYVEPAWVSRRLFEVERFPRRIYDPACGWGTILKSAKLAGYKVAGMDVVDRKRHRLGKDFQRCDFLAAVEHSLLKKVDGAIVCNPPFDRVEAFCRAALAVSGKVAMIMLVRRLNAARWLLQLPLRRVWLLTPRPSMPPGSLIATGHKPSGGTQDFCWLVFEREYVGPVTLGWLHRGERHASPITVNAAAE